MTFDLKTEYVFHPGDPQDANAEFDHPDTVGVIAQALKDLGHEVVLIGNASKLIESLDRLKVDLVFNIAEGYFGRNREAQVPVLLEMSGIPYAGSDGLTQALTLDKVMAKKILLAEGIPTPRFFQMASAQDPVPSDLAFPLIVKPRCEGSSKGLSEKSLVHEADALRAQAAVLIRTYHQPALVEEFISGREFTVAVVGNEPPEALPVVQIKIEGQTELGSLFYTFSRIAAGVEYLCPARIDPGLTERLKELALRTYQAVDCLDFGRVDFRVDEKGNPFVLEINPLPSLSTEDVFMAVARALGIGYPEMIGRIVEAAAQRLGIRAKTPSEMPAARSRR